ncbi:hypothetical protein [Paracoccus denitrificans]|uniref:hypothetical protein n=1 Tax=Paracoccus denitrificans TaxID=266 RepID=UPI003364ED29
MIATWPTVLPRPERDSWQLQPQDARRKRQNAAGPPGYRRRFSSVARSVSLSVVLDHDQREIFEAFFHDTCQEGSLRFWMPDPTRDGWPLTTEAGVPLLVNETTREPLTISERWLCAWGDQLPTETILGREFRKAFQIWVLP